MARVRMKLRFAALWVSLVACGGKQEGEYIRQAPVRGNDSGVRDTATVAGSDGDSGASVASSPFRYSAVLSGGLVRDPSLTFGGETISLESGHAQLTEDASGFKIVLEYADEVDGTGFATTCVLPVDFVGGVPAEAASEDSIGVGCPSVRTGSETYDQGIEGLTLVEVNDGSVVSGTFALNTHSEAGFLLVAEGAFHAELCDTFWDGTGCSW